MSQSHARRALGRAVALAAAAGALATAAPASAEPVKAGPALPDELAVLAVGGAAPNPSQFLSDQVGVHRLSTATGAYRGRVAFPATDSPGAPALTAATQATTTPLRQRTLRRSVDGRYLTFVGLSAPFGGSFLDSAKSTAVRIAADGTWTDTPFGTGFIQNFGQESTGAVTVDGTRFWTGANYAAPFGTIAPGDTAVARVSATLDGNANSVDIVDGELFVTVSTGVWRRTGALPTALDTTTPLQRVIALTDAFDSAFVDADGVAGVDTAYVSRGARGLWKYVLDGTTWKPAGSITGGYAWLAARAVAGAVEIYASDALNTRVQKLTDTAEIGGEITTTGPATLAYAPAKARYAGVAFAPGTGFTAEPQPYPATPPAVYTTVTRIDAALQSSPKTSVTLEVADPNTPAADLTVTAASTNQTALPNDKIEITGSGHTRTLTIDPAAIGSGNLTVTVKAGDEQTTLTLPFTITGVAPDPTSHYYSGLVDLSATIDAGGDYFLGMSDEVNVIQLYKKGVSGFPLASYSLQFPGGEGDFESVTRAGDLLVWSGSHGNNRNGTQRPERRYLGFTKISGSGLGVDLEWAGSYTRLWDDWKAWDASNGHGLGANYLKFNSATIRGLIPNAPNGFNVEGLTMAPGSTTEAWFGMRAPTITGADGIERALLLSVKNIDKLTSNSVAPEFGAPILLNLGGRSIRDISKNAADQYLITAGTGDTDDSLKNWALYTWDGNPAHDPQFVNELATDESRIGAWEGIVDVPNPLVAGSRTLLTADSGDAGLGKAYGQYVTIGQPVQGPEAVTGVTATAKPGAVDLSWNAAERASRYYVSLKTADGVHAPGSPFFATGTSRTVEGLAAGTEYTVVVRAENVATRSANSTAVKVTPAQGERIQTTTSVEFVGDRIAGETHKLIATVSDPRAQGTIQFFHRGNQTLRDAEARTPDGQIVSVFPVVDGKAEINITREVFAGAFDFSARFTTTNAENFSSSTSPALPVYLTYNPKSPGVEITSITGDRVAGGTVTIKARLLGYRTSDFPTEVGGGFYLRLPDGQVTNVTGNTPQTQYGSAEFDANGEATITTTQLPAGTIRLFAWIAGNSATNAGGVSGEIPVPIAAAGDPIAELPQYKRPSVALTVSGPRLTSANQTLTAHVSDPSLAGTVQFMNDFSSPIGAPVPVVNGVATTSAKLPQNHFGVLARFEPAQDRDRTIAPISPAVPVGLGTGTVEPPFGAPTATTTTLQLDGEPVAGVPYTAHVEVGPGADNTLAARTVNGYVEVLDNGARIGFSPVLHGRATIELGTLNTGSHSISARYVSSDELRSAGSASAAQAITVVAKTDVETETGGDVPPTLSLVLGAPASFGTFAAGVERDYTASTTATVVSTAGDAALAVSAPGHLMNGTFALPSPLEVSFSKSAWSDPVSNDAVAIEFKQHIGAGDALRSGTYSKSLTFTLSTTTP